MEIKVRTTRTKGEPRLCRRRSELYPQGRPHPMHAALGRTPLVDKGPGTCPPHFPLALV